MENYNTTRLAANSAIGDEVSDILAEHLINLTERHLGNSTHTLHRVSEVDRSDVDNYTVLALCSTGSLCALVTHQVVGGEMAVPTVTVFRTADIHTVVENVDGVLAYLKFRDEPMRLPSNVKAIDVLGNR